MRSRDAGLAAVCAGGSRELVSAGPACPCSHSPPSQRLPPGAEPQQLSTQMDRWVAPAVARHSVCARACVIDECSFVFLQFSSVGWKPEVQGL